MKQTFLSVILLFFSALSFGQQAETVFGKVLIQIKQNGDVSAVQQDFSVEFGVLPRFEVVRCISRPFNIWLCSFDENTIQKRDVLNFLNNHGHVLVAQANHVVRERDTIPNDPFFNQQWHHQETGDHDVDSELAWDITTGGVTATGDDIVVCVVETGGAKWDQTDILPNHWVNSNEIPDNDIDDDGNGYVDDYDGWNITNDTDNLNSGNHGTQVSSMIGARGNNNTGISGINWDVKLMQVQMGNISEASVIEAYTYAYVMRDLYNQTGGEQGAFVVAVNSSWGTDFGQAEDAPLWCGMYDSLGEVGVISCGATSNQNINIDEEGDLPTSCPSEFLIGVTATNDADIRTFSGFGVTHVDLGAPGESVYLAGSNNYGTTSGTSFASPCVAGAIALLYSAPCTSLMAIAYADPATAAQMVREYIFEGVDAVSNLADETATGGRLNVYNSLSLLMNECSNDECIPPFAISSEQQGLTLDYLLEWGSTDAMTAFSVRFRPVGEVEWTTITALTETSYLATDLLACAEYEVQVMASCINGTSDWSASYILLTDGCCVHPGGTDLISVSANSAVIGWEPVLAADGYTAELYIGDVLISAATNISATSWTFDGLEPCTGYAVIVLSQCSGDEIPEPQVFYFNTSGCGSCQDIEYCSIDANSDTEYIQNVTLGTINNTSPNDGGYGDYTDMSTILVAGETYEISCDPGYSGFSYSEYFLVWIDFDGNGVFDDDEIVFDPGFSTTEAVSGSFTVPTWVQNGSVRMRVSMSYLGTWGGELPVACGQMDYGEAEDYCVTLDNPLSVTEKANSVLDVFPNPVSGILFVRSTRDAAVSMWDVSGRQLFSIDGDEMRQVDVRALAAGIYFVVCQLPDGTRATARIIRE